MFKIINILIIHLISIIPKSIIKIFAKNYVAGITIREAIKIVRNLNNQNLSATLDILGEHTKRKSECLEITNSYKEILKEINNNNLDCNISIKPSHIGTDINKDFFEKNLQTILDQAIKYNNFVRIDMENSNLTDTSINTYKAMKVKNLGIVLQAYLYRTNNDINKLNAKSNIRLCKGIYNESSNIAIKKPEQINANYLKLLKNAFKKGMYVGIATHDKKLIQQSLSLIKEMKINKNNFEFQMLYGVPMKTAINNLLENNYKVRIYVPFGSNWYDYSIRRIKENPNISKYVIKNFFLK
tara:strand:- start:1149 stop:2042 length:894 start_codon:yes stop_codon:yes gene_type:complete